MIFPLVKNRSKSSLGKDCNGGGLGENFSNGVYVFLGKNMTKQKKNKFLKIEFESNLNLLIDLRFLGMKGVGIKGEIRKQKKVKKKMNEKLEWPRNETDT